MAIDFEAAFGGPALDDVETMLKRIKGEQLPTSWTDLAVIDLADIAPETNFEEPGLHKRVRACLGGLLNRSGRNVNFEWESSLAGRRSEYSDYDRVFRGELSTTGSSWGSERVSAVRLLWATHITTGGTIDDEPLYVDGLGLYGVGSDSAGTLSVGFRLFVPAHHSDRRPLHPEVLALWDNLIARAASNVLEDLLRDRDYWNA